MRSLTKIANHNALRTKTLSGWLPLGVLDSIYPDPDPDYKYCANHRLGYTLWHHCIVRWTRWLVLASIHCVLLHCARQRIEAVSEESLDINVCVYDWKTSQPPMQWWEKLYWVHSMKNVSILQFFPECWWIFRLVIPKRCESFRRICLCVL